MNWSISFAGLLKLKQVIGLNDAEVQTEASDGLRQGFKSPCFIRSAKDLNDLM